MSMQKTMIFLICLGVLLVGIVTIPSVFAADGCGPGTVLVDGVCELAPEESGDGCGPGTVMVNGACQLAETSGTSIQPLYIVIGAVAVGGGIIGAIFIVRRRSKTTKTSKPAKQDLEEYETQYLSRQNVRPNPKPTMRKETSSICTNCGKPLKPMAKFCGKCGNPCL